MRRRARDIGLKFGQVQPGPANAITDVAGVRVGHTTLVRGSGELTVGNGPVRTGVTVVLPREAPMWRTPVFAGAHVLNGNGELTGLAAIREFGTISSPIALTTTHSVGVVRDALVEAEAAQRPKRDLFWRLPVVGETWDGILNDINGAHLKAGDVHAALAAAKSGHVDEGSVGGGTGMICHGFKGGIGTASRVLPPTEGGYTVGVLVQANHGRRERLTIEGMPVGMELSAQRVPEPIVPGLPEGRAGGGSIIVVIATDAPLLPHQCSALAQRAGLGVARTGGSGETWSGDMFLALSTANPELPGNDYGASPLAEIAITMVAAARLDPLYDAVIDATEEAIVNALLAAETMEGRDGIVAQALQPDLLAATLRDLRGPS